MRCRYLRTPVATPARQVPLLLPAPPAPLQPSALLAPLSADTPGIGRIAVWGDAGTADEAQHRVARAISAEHARAPFASALVLGDNVYNYGEPEKFDAAIRAPYSDLFDHGVRFLPVLGNHDLRGGYGENQRQYWGMPRWYQASVGELDVFALDTTILLPSKKYAVENANLTARQLEWFERALAASGTRHKIVFGHHPLYVSSNEDKKVADAARRRALLEPILRKYGVRLYLSGHQHHYERSREINGVTHIVSGAGGGQLADATLRRVSGQTAALAQRRHFVVLERSADGLRVRAVSEDGETLDEFTLRP